MKAQLAVILTLIAIAGCQSAPKSPLLNKLSKSKPRPESNVPPRRLAADDEAGRASTRGSKSESANTDDISLTEFSPGNSSGGGVELTGATIVARVNSVPIFAEDVLEPWTPQLEKAAGQLTPDELNRLRAKLIRESLPRHLEKAVLVSAMKDSLKRDELTRLNEQLDRIWKTQELESLKTKYEVLSTVELERKLEAQGTTLANFKQSFSTREMAMFYIGQQSQKAAPKLGPDELRAWYDEHQEEFRVTGKARWQQIHVSFAKHGGRDEAKKKLATAITDLKNGADFGDVAQTYSDGPNAAEGGVWDWTNQGSVAHKKVDTALFELPINKISLPIETRDSWVLVKVLERVDAGYRPFEEVKDGISKQILGANRKETAERTIRELTEAATIWTIFDKS